MGNAVPRMCDDVSTIDGTRARSVGADARGPGGKVVPRMCDDDVVGTTMKVVLTRKEAERLIARLQEDSSARERHARIAELTGKLRAGVDGRIQETWKPRLRTIQEN